MAEENTRCSPTRRITQPLGAWRIIVAAGNHGVDDVDYTVSRQYVRVGDLCLANPKALVAIDNDARTGQRNQNGFATRKLLPVDFSGNDMTCHELTQLHSSTGFGGCLK